MSGLAGVDLTDLDNFADGFPHALFAEHRRAAPVFWHEPTAHTPGGEGFWSVATYADTLEVLRDPVTYSSERGGDREHGGTLLQDLEVAGLVLNMMDDPRHARIRRLVSVGLTPRMVRRLEDELRDRTAVLVDAIGADEEVDIVAALAAELPMQAICTLLGVPHEDRHRLWAVLGANFDIREGDEVAMGAQAAIFSYGVDLLAEKRAHPTDDLLSIAAHATLDDLEPPQLTDLELLAFFSLLFAAGSDTSRHAISGGLLALAERPTQLEVLRADVAGVLPTAVEEILRWTSPSPSKRRTATEPTALAGHRIEAGDKVLFWEGSANRDEAAFVRPGEFDVRRAPNPHLALGHGAHFCLGASLARLELRVVIEAVLEAFVGIEVAGPPEWTRSNRHTGIRRLPLRLHRA